MQSAFRDGIGLNVTGAEMDRLSAEVSSLEQTMAKIAEVKAGDRLALDVQADGSVAISYNGAAQGTLGGLISARRC